MISRTRYFNIYFPWHSHDHISLPVVVLQIHTMGKILFQVWSHPPCWGWVAGFPTEETGGGGGYIVRWAGTSGPLRRPQGRRGSGCRVGKGLPPRACPPWKQQKEFMKISLKIYLPELTPVSWSNTIISFRRPTSRNPNECGLHFLKK